MKLYDIPSARGFFNRVLDCKGPVYRDGMNGARRDLKAEAEYLISSGLADCMGGIPKIEIDVERNEDFVRMLHYVSEMHC